MSTSEDHHLRLKDAGVHGFSASAAPCAARRRGGIWAVSFGARPAPAEKIDTSAPSFGRGAYKPDDLPAKKDIEVGYALGIAKLSGDLSFMNIAKARRR
ncbi:MAG: hypothetical protein ACLUW6_03175 [Coriobacteriaceae bacterium]